MATNPISSINTFLNKSFGIPLPKSQTPAPILGPVNPNMSVAPKAVTPANPAATATKPAAIKPAAKPSALPPAGQQFVNNLTTPANNGLSTIPGPYDAATGKLKDTSGGATGTATAPDAPKAPESPYLAYLKSMFDPEALKTSASNIDQLNQRTADELLGTRKREDELRKNDIGQLETGQDYQIRDEARLSNRSLADLAIAKSAAQETYDRMIGAGKSVFEAETAAAKAEQDQLNKDRDFGLDKETLQLNKDKAAQDKLQADRQFEEDKRQFGLNYALDQKKYNLDALKVSNDNPNSPAALSKKDEEASSSLNLINQLINNDDLGSIFGSLGQYKPSLILGSGGNLALNQFNQVKGQLALENRAKLKGQGAVSDFEGRVLDSAASALGRNLSDADGVKQLKQIRGAIATSHGLPADVRVSNPRTNESSTVSADSAAIAAMVKDGLLVEYQ